MATSILRSECERRAEMVFETQSKRATSEAAFPKVVAITLLCIDIVYPGR